MLLTSLATTPAGLEPMFGGAKTSCAITKYDTESPGTTPPSRLWSIVQSQVPFVSLPLVRAHGVETSLPAFLRYQIRGCSAPATGTPEVSVIVAASTRFAVEVVVAAKLV